MKRELKGIEIFNVILIAIIVLCSMTIFRMNIMSGNVSNIPTAEVKVSKRYDKVNINDRNTQSEYVTFDAFFLKDLDGDGKADAIRGTCNEVGKADTLYFELRVLDNGHLENGTITINGQNFYLGTSIVRDDIVKYNYLSTDTKKIVLNDIIDNGSQKLFMGVVRSGDYSNQYSKTSAIGNDTTKYSRENTITLKGTHVADDGTRTPISKVVPFNVDWYGKTTATIATTNVSHRLSSFSSLYNDTTLNLSFTVQTAETSNQLILKDNVLKGKIPDLNGYMPTSVTITGTGTSYTYNKETGEFEVRRDAVINGNGVVTSNAYTSQSYNNRYNSYSFKVCYPLEAYDVTSNKSITIKVPMQTYYEGYNNPNEAFDNPYVSNVANSTVVVTWYEYIPTPGVIPSPGASVYIGRYLGNPYYKYYISKEKPLKMYNGISDGETQDYYTVNWYVYAGGYEHSKLLIKEDVKGASNVIDTFIKSNASEESTEDVVSTVGIYFSNLASLVGNDGWLKVYDDDTDKLLVTFTKDNWSGYSASNPYMYENPVKRVRVETSKVNANSSINIYHVKEIDDTAMLEKYDREQFDALQHIKTHMKVYFGDSNSAYDRSATAVYEAPFSVASIGISQDQISTQEIYENEVITISATSSNFMEQKWKDGKFILKMPQEIIDMSINSVTVNNSNVKISDTSLYEENGNYYLRIETENEEPTTYTISVNCNLAADPRTPTATKQIEMYAKNGDGVDYYYREKDIYDVDTNGNKEENVHKSTIGLTLISPNNLLTHQIAKNYDDKGNIAIAPQVAKVEKSQRKADIEITLTNNYANKITNVLVQGVIPFEGNKFVIGKRELGSDFTTTMSNTGIQLPAELREYATVYYSTLDRPTNDITDPTNGWVTAENVADWTQIKTFIIDLGDYELQIGESKVFKYEINIPQGLNYNQISYSEHGVYFDLETDAGLYSTSTAVSKLGFMIAKQYDLEITKYQENTTKKLPSVTFKLTEVGNENESIKKLTDENGQIVITGLYAERKYKLQETRISDDYVLNNEEIEFYTYVDENDKLILKYYDQERNRYEDLADKYDWIKSAVAVKEEGQDYKVQIVLEDEVKAKIKVTKTNGSGEALRGARFALTGEGKNMTLVTNADGIASASGLYLNKTYTLQETRATGYYLIEQPITFSIKSTASGFELTVNGQTTSANITTVDEIPTINISLDDEEVPKYSLKVKKYAEHKEEGDEIKTLAGAQFRLTGDGLPERGVLLTTNENGELNIDGLYEYVAKNGSAKGGFEAQYTLVETYAPEGFALDGTPVKFKASRDNGELKVQILSGEDRISELGPVTVTNATSAAPTVEFALEDPPIFTLKKFDENGQPLAGAKFSIFLLNDDLTVKSYAKDLTGNFIGDHNETNNAYTITTPESGMFTLNLPQGLYKAVEVEAPEGFELSANEADRTEYFGVGASKAEQTQLKLTWKKPVKGEGFNTINSIVGTTDGGTISVGSVYGATTLSEDGSENITSLGRKDGLIVKHDEDGDIEWVKNIGGTLGEEFKKVIQTKDGGYAVVGYFESETMNVGNGAITNSGARDAILIKLNPSGEYEWSAVIGGTLEDYAYSLCEDNSGNILVSGGYFSNTLSFKGTNGVAATTLTNLGDMDGYVASFSSTGAFNWAQNLGSTNATSGVQAVDVAVVNDSYVVAANFWGALFVDSDKSASIANLGNQDSALVYYSTTGAYQKHISVSGAGNDDIRGVALDQDGNMVVYGNRTNSTTTLKDVNGAVTVNAVGGTTYLSSYIYRLDNDGLYLADLSFTFGNSEGNDEIMEVVPTEDYGLLIAGFTYSSTLDIDNDGTNDMVSTGDTNLYFSRGFIAKLDENNKVIKALRQYNQGTYQETRTVAATKDGGMVAGGVVDGTTLYLDPTGETLTGFDAYSEDGYIVKYGNVVTSPEVAEKTELNYTNKLKRFKVTTTEYSIENLTAEDINREKQDDEWKYGEKTVITGKYGQDKLLYDTGAAVTGDYGKYNGEKYLEADHVKYVETIIYNQNGQKQIVITPETDYSVVGILINGKEHTYSVSETDGSVIIPIFEAVKEDKHIDVIVDKNMAQIRVNHYLWTETDGKTTTKVADSESYFGKVDTDYTTKPRTDIKYEIVTNKDIYGNITEAEVQTKTGKTLAELGYTEITDPEDENYGKSPLEQFLNAYYTPENARGKYQTETQIINYYYKEKEYKLTVRHFIEGTEERVPNKNTGNPIEDEVTEKLKSGTPYSTTKSEEIDYSVYELVSVNTTDEVATIDEENLNTTGTITEDTTVTYYYRVKDGAEVIVHHYIVGTETKVPSSTGEPVEDETINTVIDDGTERQAKVGDRYTTNYTDNLALGYRIAKNSDVFAGKTEQEVLEAIGINSWTETRFASFEEFLEANYLPGNYTGRFASVTQEVTYYYIIETPKVVTGITKDVDKKALKETDEDQSLTYTIVYNTTINDYIGDASITIKDTLPFEIDTSKPYSLDKGSYDPATKTITWRQAFSVNTYTDITSGVISIPKTITLTYKDVAPLTTTLVNTVEGITNLIDQNIITDPVRDTAVTTLTQDRNVSAIKVWNDNDDSLSIRPRTVNVNLIGRVEGQASNVNLRAIDSTIETTVEFSSSTNWKHTWKSLPKYNTDGKEITYSVEEEALTGNLAIVYSAAVTGDMANGYTITNTYTRPTQKTTLTVKKEWDDNNNEYDKRPAQIKFEVYSGASTKVTEYLLNTATETSHTFELDKYDAKGNIIEYTAKEVEANAGDLKYYDAPQERNGEAANEVIFRNKFKTLTTEETSSITKTGTETIYRSSDKVNYRINYKAEIKDYLGKATLEIVDYLPYHIDEAQSDLKDGVYSADDKTITWTFDIDVDTIANGTCEIEKNFIIDVVFTDIDLTKTSMINDVKGKLTLKNKVDEVEDDTPTEIDVKSGVIVHHYIENTVIQLAPDDKIQDQKVGTDYTTNVSPKVPKNYEVVSVVTEDDKATKDENTLETKGHVKEDLIVVIYYYNLKQETITNDIEKTAKATKEVEVTNEETGAKETHEVLTKEDGVVTYTIKYNYSIKDYIGKAKVTVTDTLPAKINLEKSNLAEGTYDEATNTITWEEKVENINTYECEGEIYKGSVEKQISVVFDGQDVNAVLDNKAKGTTVTYYPDDNPTKPGEEKTTVQAEDNAPIEQEYKVERNVIKVWDDNNNERGNRPEKLEAILKTKDKTVDTAVLSKDNSWEHTFKDLDKYDAEGNLMEYSITEKEVEANDLEYYEEAIIEVENNTTKITNKYRKLSNKIDSKIEKDGTKELVGKQTEVQYSIKYNATITQYIGEAKATITDYLPYKIDVNKSDLQGGTYDEETKTITWTQDLGHINTVKNGDFKVEIAKQIKVNYIDIDAKAEKMTNKVKGKVELIPTGEKDEVEADHDTILNLLGKIIVKYKDIDTDLDIPYTDENGEQKYYNYDEEGYIGDDYTTKKKDIPYYEFVKVTDNKDGQFKKETQTIIYYYRKLPFNIAIDKTVKEISVNGAKTRIEDNKLAKLEIPQSKLATTDVIVRYRIVVKNTEKVDGKADIIDTIPAGFELASTNPDYWTQLQGRRIQTNVELKVGQQKELEVVLKWQNSNQNLGTTKNIVEVTNTDNPPKYPDNNSDDNISVAEVILTVKTGADIKGDILTITGILGLIVLLSAIVIDKKIIKRKGNDDKK